MPARSASSLDRARTIIYSPDPDGTADPGEIVWAWVPYEEDPARGKDRPLLVVGRHGRNEYTLLPVPVNGGFAVALTRVGGAKS